MPVDLRARHYRFGIASGTESSHGWYDNEDHSPDPGIIGLDTTFLLRFSVQEVGGTAAANVDNQFQYSKNGGAFTNITTSSSNVRAVTTTVFADGANLTKRLSGTGTFEASAAGGTHDGLSGGNNNDIASLGNSETECALQLRSADLQHGDLLQFRLTSPDFTMTNEVLPALKIQNHGVLATAAAGTLVKVLSVALVGLSLTAGQGALTGSGSDGATALTGSAMTSAAGTVVQSASRALTGILLSGSQGVMVPNGRSLIQSAQGTALPNLAIPLLGSALTSQQGFTFANRDGTVGPLMGQAITVQQGDVIAPNSIPLTGSEITSAAGPLTPNVIPTQIPGQAIVSAQGTVTIAANDITVHITGEEITSAQGSVDPRPILVGQLMTSGIGSLTQFAEAPLVGLAMTGAQGAMGIGQDPDDIYLISQSGTAVATSAVPLTGAAMTGAQGTVATSADAVFALTGEESPSAAGTLAPTMTVALSGVQIAGFQSNLGAPGGATLVGQEMTGQQGPVFTTEDREQAISGAAMTLAIGSVMTEMGPRLTGQGLTSAPGSLSAGGGFKQAALSGSAMTLSQGSVAAVGGDDLDSDQANEGCGVTSGAPQEGCGVTYALAQEAEFLTFGWGDLPWGDPWGGYETNSTVSAVAEEVAG